MSSTENMTLHVSNTESQGIREMKGGTAMGRQPKLETYLVLTREELSVLNREEMLDYIEHLQKQAAYWKYRFQCVDKEYDVVCWKYHIPRY